jgi:hypothetical protein
LIIMAAASGTPVPAIARLVAADEDTVRGVIHRFNEIGLRALDPRWAGGPVRAAAHRKARRTSASSSAVPRDEQENQIEVLPVSAGLVAILTLQIPLHS